MALTNLSNASESLALCYTYKWCIAHAASAFRFLRPHVRFPMAITKFTVFLSINGYKNCALLWFGSA